MKVKVKSLSRFQLFATPWTVACPRLLHPWDFLGKSSGVGCHFLLQGIFPTQGSNPGLLHCRQTLSRLSHQRSQISHVESQIFFSTAVKMVPVAYSYDFIDIRIVLMSPGRHLFKKVKVVSHLICSLNSLISLNINQMAWCSS